MISIGGVEALWIGVNTLTLIVTFAALLDAIGDLRDVTGADRRRARLMTARGNVRSEFLRLVVQGILLGLALPEMLVDREIGLSLFVVAMLAIAVILLIQTVLDAYNRHRLKAMLLADVATERTALALETSVQENIELTHKAIEHAEAAYNEANHVNEKIAALTALVGGKEDKPEGAT